MANQQQPLERPPQQQPERPPNQQPERPPKQQPERPPNTASKQQNSRQDKRSLDEILNPETDPDADQYGNLDEPDLDLYGDLEQRELVRDAPPDLEAQDQYGPQNPIGSTAEPGTPGGQGLYDIQDQYGQDPEIVPPGSDKDQYGTKGSQDQYGDQQNVG